MAKELYEQVLKDLKKIKDSLNRKWWRKYNTTGVADIELSMKENTIQEAINTIKDLLKHLD